MGQRVDSGFKTLPAAGAIAKHKLVTTNVSGQWVECGASDRPVASVQGTGSTAAGEPLSCKLLTGPGSHILMAGAGVDAAAAVSNIASGKVDDTSEAGSWSFGIALEAAVADGDLIEVIPIVSGTDN